jgi:hypothetical protein
MLHAYVTCFKMQHTVPHATCTEYPMRQTWCAEAPPACADLATSRATATSGTRGRCVTTSCSCTSSGSGCPRTRHAALHTRTRSHTRPVRLPTGHREDLHSTRREPPIVARSRVQACWSCLCMSMSACAPMSARACAKSDAENSDRSSPGAERCCMLLHDARCTLCAKERGRTERPFSDESRQSATRVERAGAAGRAVGRVARALHGQRKRQPRRSILW